MRVLFGLLLLCAAGEMAVAADLVLSPADAGVVLRKVAAAARKQNYVGAYVHQHDGEVETFSLMHSAEADGELEKRDSLDGPRREFVRSNDQVSCYLPELPANPSELRRRVSIKLFPAILPDEPADLVNVYQFRKLDPERVAGYDAAVVLLEPKDNLRYGRKLWYDPVSGLMLRVGVFNSKREIVEQLSFTQVTVGSQVDRKLLKPKFSNKVTLKPAEAAMPEIVKSDAGFEVRPMPQGFRLVQEGMRTLGQRAGPVSHLMLSDGLSAVSVFIEPQQQTPKSVNMMVSHGVMNIYTHFSPDSRITAVGDVPQAALLLIGNSVVPKAPKSAAASRETGGSREQ